MQRKSNEPKPPRGNQPSSDETDTGNPIATPAPRELVVIAEPDAGLRASSRGVFSTAGANTESLADLLSSSGLTLAPLFGASEERLKYDAMSIADTGGAAPPDLSVFYKVEAPDYELESIAEKLRDHEVVQAAFIKPGTEPAQALNNMAPSPEPAPPVTADFTARQEYLNIAPGGIDARFAWTVNGGSGAGIRIIDIEGAWRFSHEDLLQNQGGVVGGTQSADLVWRNHGTAVVGEFGGDRNTFGITGICPDANVRAISIFGNSPAGWGSAAAIRRAADSLSPGDIILLELHRPGPRFNFQGRNDQRGYIAIEWWPDDLLAIQYAVSRGVIVVEAAGNGAENLDDAVYDTNPASPNGPFPAWWRNPFRRNAIDSGAIVVGAGAPPPGTHGRTHGPDRSRLDFSNFGRLIDAQGWGREVTTCGYGDLQGGSNEDFWYTDMFSGTSSASPIVVGALGCAQGARRAASQALLTPATARALLRSTGSPQQDGPSGTTAQRIGNRPNLRQMIGGSQSLTNTVPLFRYWNSGAGDHFYTTNWAELGSGRYGWAYEGVQCHVLPNQRIATVPLYRYWNPGNADHFYTTNWAELGYGRYGWGYEGIQCYVYPAPVPGTVPLYRYWNPGIGDHFYTTNWGELGYGRYGWGYEGIQCYVFSTPTLAPSMGDAPGAGDTPPPESGPGFDPIASGTEGTSGLVGTPSTFEMGGGGDSSMSTGPSGYPNSFQTPEGEGGGTGGESDSFKIVGGSKSGGAKPGGGPGNVTINVNLGGSSDES